MSRRALALLALLLAPPAVAGPAPAAPPAEARPAAPAPNALGRALELRSSGDLEGARQVLLEHLATRPEDTRARYLLAVLLLESGHPGEGLEALLETLDRDPAFPEARASLAGAVQARIYELVDRGDCDEAEALRARLAPRLEDEATALFLEGAIHLERWRRTGERASWDRALEAWGRSRDRKPVSAVTELLAGLAAFEGRVYERACEHFRYALQIRGRNRYARLWLGLSQAALGRYDAALETLEACRPTFGANPALHRALGDLHFARALGVSPPDPDALDQAEACYLRARELWPDNPRLLASLGDLLSLRDRWEEAARAYGEALRARPDPALALRLGSLLLDLGRTGEARACFEAAGEGAVRLEGPGERRRTGARAALGAALALAEEGEVAKARGLVEGQTAVLPRTDPLALLARGALGPDGGQREAALRQVLEDERAEAGPSRLLAWTWLGHLEEERDQRVRAMRCYAEALGLATPGSPRAAALLDRFQALRQEELDDLAAWQAHNGLVFVVDVLTGGARSGSLEARRKALEELQPGEPGSGRRPGRAPVPAWPAELEGDLSGLVRASGARAEVEPPRSWLEK